MHGNKNSLRSLDVWNKVALTAGWLWGSAAEEALSISTLQIGHLQSLCCWKSCIRQAWQKVWPHVTSAICSTDEHNMKA